MQTLTNPAFGLWDSDDWLPGADDGYTKPRRVRRRPLVALAPRHYEALPDERAAIDIGMLVFLRGTSHREGLMVVEVRQDSADKVLLLKSDTGELLEVEESRVVRAQIVARQKGLNRPATTGRSSEAAPAPPADIKRVIPIGQPLAVLVGEAQGAAKTNARDYLQDLWLEILDRFGVDALEWAMRVAFGALREVD